jgi:hypothetical protein
MQHRKAKRLLTLCALGALGIALSGQLPQASAEMITTEQLLGKRGSPSWAVPLVTESKDMMQQMWPGNSALVRSPGLIPPGLTPNDDFTLTPSLRIPISHIGFYNVSQNRLGIVLTVGMPEPRTILLNAGELATVDCAKCAREVTAIIPRAQVVRDDDVRMIVSPGKIYVPAYDPGRSAWTLNSR